MRIDGKVEGQLGADCVMISESAVVRGEIRAKKVVVGGKSEGNIHPWN